MSKQNEDSKAYKEAKKFAEEDYITTPVSVLAYIDKLEADRDALPWVDEAAARIKNILIQHDEQAYKEAEKFLDKLEGEG